MRAKLPVYLDCPEKQAVGVTAVSWYEIVFHVVTFCVMVSHFREDQQDAWYTLLILLYGM